MLNRLNSIWKHLIFDFIGAVTVALLIVYNLLYKFNNPDINIIGCVLGLLALHGLLLFILFIKNLIDKNYLKALGFIIITIILFIGIWLSFMAILVFLIGAQSLDNGYS